MDLKELFTNYRKENPHLNRTELLSVMRFILWVNNNVLCWWSTPFTAICPKHKKELSKCPIGEQK